MSHGSELNDSKHSQERLHLMLKVHCSFSGVHSLVPSNCCHSSLASYQGSWVQMDLWQIKQISTSLISSDIKWWTDHLQQQCSQLHLFFHSEIINELLHRKLKKELTALFFMSIELKRSLHFLFSYTSQIIRKQN